MYKRMPFIKCPRCRCMRDETEYDVYKGTRRKTCLKCKEITKKQREKAKKNEQVTTVETNNDKDPTRYITHQKVFRKLNNEFLERAGKSVHIYEMKYAFVDIRDHRIHSDKDFNFTNY